MTKADTIRLAREAGLTVYEGDQDRVLFEGSIVDGLKRLIELAAAEEREACAKVVEQGHYAETRAGHAAAIRARSQQ